jgi:hypothetical protein
LVKWQPVGGRNYPVRSKDLGCPTRQSAAFDIIGEKPALSNPENGRFDEVRA